MTTSVTTAVTTSATVTAKRLPSLGLALLLAAGLGLAGCSSGGSESSSAGADSADSAASLGSADTEVGEEQAAGTRPDALQDGSLSFSADSASRVAAPGKAVDTSPATEPGAEPAIIQTGTLTVESDDVAGARFDLDKLLDTYGGSVADEKTTASDEGDVRLSRVELRVPSAEFDAAMTGIGELGKVTESTRKAQDVTGEVIDTEARIRAQEQSLQRIEVLFGQAQDIGDIVSIEAQLSRRQAELDSLKGQLAYLQDQTTLSTITVYLEQSEPAAVPPAPEEDDLAFVGGLKDGWEALGSLGAGLAVVVGALLPFALVAVLLGVPAALVGRRLLARRPTPTA
ncbi:DUF4349 domain-containing protein [Nocardioides sp. AX2bis]|uniref:DUF4349 domain-containing protein n=1 Tax=Nocardioides sp. AX2bis TaxID=2653157 RepID=UPI0012F41566|nr:DUF4349 domain-containing protein [Nocardioides sp. AX2bis]VXB84743.1 conserved hypothetical protein [Nocardioides sp. AX2bis]